MSVIGLANHYFLTTRFTLFEKLIRRVGRMRASPVTVLVGAELCVLDSTGQIRLTPAEANQLDFVLAGPHHFRQRWVERPIHSDASGFVAQQHKTLLNAARHPLVNGVAHPWVLSIQHAQAKWSFSTEQFLAAWSEKHFAELGEVAQRSNTAIEVGMGLFMMAEHQGEPFWTRYRRGMQAARSAGARFYAGSDAHHLHTIARLDWLAETLHALQFSPQDMIDPLEFCNQRHLRSNERCQTD